MRKSSYKCIIHGPVKADNLHLRVPAINQVTSYIHRILTNIPEVFP